MLLRIFLVAVWLLGASGCASLPAFEPSKDCGRIPYCGQCASRGGCGWCDGRCMAVARAQCSTPESFCRTPDLCPAPPEQALAQTVSGDAKQEAVQRALAYAFPQAKVTPNIVDSIVRLLIFRGAGKDLRSRSGPNQDGTGREVE